MSKLLKKPVLSVVASALGSNYDGAANYCCPVLFGGAARFWLASCSARGRRRCGGKAGLVAAIYVAHGKDGQNLQR